MRHKKSFLVYKKVITDSRNKAVKGNLMSWLLSFFRKKVSNETLKLHKIESSERLDSLMSRAKEHNDLMMLKTLNKPDFLASAVYP
jgi:hypothetical protein